MNVKVKNDNIKAMKYSLFSVLRQRPDRAAIKEEWSRNFK
jgi:hypothetical protein